MPGENSSSLLDQVTDRISKDVIKAMSKDLSAPSDYAEPLRNIVYRKIRETLVKNGFEEHYNQRLDNAVYKEDVKDEYDYFLAGGIRLPEEVNYRALRPVVEDFTKNVEDYLTSSEYRAERRVNGRESTEDPNYIEWVMQYKAYRDANLRKDSLWFDTAAYDVEKGYVTRPDFLVTKENTYNVGLKEPEEPRMITFGDETKSPMYDMTKKGYVGHGPEGRTRAFDELLGNLQAESCMGNPDVNADYKHFINCFSIDGHNIDYRETGDKKLDEENLKKAKSAIVDAIASRKIVEFTKFTMDGKGKCNVETIPIAHANFAKDKNNIKHVVGPADLKAAKLAQKITEKARKEAEKKHKIYLKQEKKAESEKRKQVVNGYKDRIRQAANRAEKNKIRAELREVQANYKKVDREQKARQKAAETERKNQLKLEQRQQKAYINKLSSDVKQIVRQQTAEAKRRERVDNERAKQAVIEDHKRSEEAKIEREEMDRREYEANKAKREAQQAEQAKAAPAATGTNRVKLSEANKEKQNEISGQVLGTAPKKKVADITASQEQTREKKNVAEKSDL
ncbi:MAG: hypothetical protein LUI60_00315 [Clostridia bacterium]|nr:hypothetical protein [Clostridia bacterium]